jgi:hypothetical protein
VEGGATSNVQRRWTLPEQILVHAEHFHVVDLDLTAEAPEGLDGIARVFILKEGDRWEPPFVGTVALEDLATDPRIWDKLEHGFGYVDYITVDRSEKEGITEGYSKEVVTEGTWSQQGFYVAYPLFRQGQSRWTKPRVPKGTPHVDFPLPVWYDLNLSGKFVLPLSVDRKSVIPTESAISICKTISYLFSTVFLEAIGPDRTRANLDFLQKVARIEPERGKPFLRAVMSRGADQHS